MIRREEEQQEVNYDDDADADADNDDDDEDGDDNFLRHKSQSAVFCCHYNLLSSSLLRCIEN